MIAFPAIVVAFSYKSLFSDEIFARWIVDYIFAYPFGIVFQFFTIAPMRRLSVGKGFVAAIKADTLSLTAWQCGMYGCMAGATHKAYRNPPRPAPAAAWCGRYCAYWRRTPIAWMAARRWCISKARSRRSGSIDAP